MIPVDLFGRTAERRMERELVAVPEHLTVGDLIDYLRERDELTTEFWEVFIVDPMMKPVGTWRGTCTTTCRASAATVPATPVRCAAR